MFPKGTAYLATASIRPYVNALYLIRLEPAEGPFPSKKHFFRKLFAGCGKVSARGRKAMPQALKSPRENRKTLRIPLIDKARRADR